jgi:spore coat polysaccharide biosynthesis protein SpsF (cytidylyltransferase family)
MSRVVAIIQARMGSSRLPGKVLMDIAGMPMLQHVVRRVQQSRSLDAVVVATTTGTADDAVAEAVTAWGCPVLRGQEDDVLDRYRQAAAASDADCIVRVTADCPLIDAQVIDQVLAAFWADPPVDYASNTLERTFPQGLDVEVTSRQALEAAWQEADAPYQRAHVMPFLYDHPTRFRLRSVTGPESLAHLRWTVDTAADLDLVRAIYDRLGRVDFGWQEALAVVQADPGLTALNAHVRQKALHEG